MCYIYIFHIPGLSIDKDVNLAQIIPECIVGAFSKGQVCISLQRIYVVDEQFDEFIELLKEAVNTLVIGNPFDNSTDISADKPY